MENLKIRVLNKQESKEAQELFFELGCRWVSGDVNYNAISCPQYVFCINNALTHGTQPQYYWDPPTEEITLPQLRDMVVLKRNDVKKEMKEYLDPKKNYELCLSHEDLTREGMIKAPEGADVATKGIGKVNFWKNQDREFYFNSRGEWSNNCGETLRGYLGRNPTVKTVWQRTTQNKEIEQEVKSNSEKYPHYFKSVKHLDEVDVYAVMDLFEVHNQAVGHAIKKLLVGGKRGAKGYLQDIKEARDTLNRAIEIMESKNG